METALTPLALFHRKRLNRYTCDPQASIKQQSPLQMAEDPGGAATEAASPALHNPEDSLLCTQQESVSGTGGWGGFQTGQLISGWATPMELPYQGHSPWSSRALPQRSYLQRKFQYSTELGPGMS